MANAFGLSGYGFIQAWMHCRNSLEEIHAKHSAMLMDNIHIIQNFVQTFTLGGNKKEGII